MAASRDVRTVAPWWWVALPDVAGADPSRLVAGADGIDLVRHGSNRPWLIGSWPAHRLDVVRAGADIAVVFSACGLVEPGRRRVRAALSQQDDLGWLAREPGVDYVAVSRSSGVTEVYSPAAVPLLWRARRDGLVVLSSHARAIASDLGVDDAWCAGRLLSPTVPWPLARRSPHAGVTAVPGGVVVTVDEAGRVARTRRWSVRPEQYDVDGAARELAAALRAETAAHSGGGRGVLAVAAGDLAACAVLEAAATLPDLAVRTVPRHVALTDSTAAAGGAPQYIDERPYDGHRQALSVGAGWAELPPLDAPPAWGLSVAVMGAAARTAAAWGATALVSSHDSHTVLRAPLAYLHRLHGRPAVEEEHLMGWASVFHVPVIRRHVRPVMQHILTLGAARQSYQDWIRGLVRTLQHPFEPWAATGWEPRPVLPYWATRYAHDLAADLLVAVADGAEPLAEDQVEHASLVAVRAAGVNAALHRDAALALAGIPVTYPYFSHAALVACLRVRPEDRSVPGRLPLLTALPRLARRAELMRTQHSHRHLVVGLLHNRTGIRDLLCGGVLADRGLIDPDLVDAAITATVTSPGLLTPLNSTLTTEQWLRCAL